MCRFSLKNPFCQFGFQFGGGGGGGWLVGAGRNATCFV